MRIKRIPIVNRYLPLFVVTLGVTACVPTDAKLPMLASISGQPLGPVLFKQGAGNSQTFQVANLTAHYSLSVSPQEAGTTALVKVNGSFVPITCSTFLNCGALTELKLKTSNTIDVTVIGKKNSSVLVNIVDTDEFTSPALAAKTYLKQQGSSEPTFNENFSVPDISKYFILTVTSVGPKISKNPAAIVINGEQVIGKTDFLFDKNNQFKKLVALKQENQISTQLYCGSGEGINVSISGIAGEEVDVESPGKITLQGLSETEFNSVGKDLTLNLEGAMFGSNNEDFSVFLNDSRLKNESIFFSANQIVIPKLLIDGHNQIEIYAEDTLGKSINFEFSLWAGHRKAKIKLADSQGIPQPQVSIIAELDESRSVKSQAATDPNGYAVFENLPEATIFFSAVSNDTNFADGALSFLEEDEILSLDMKFDPIPQVTSNVNNNFSLGNTADWSTTRPGSFTVITAETEVENQSLQSKGTSFSKSFIANSFQAISAETPYHGVITSQGANNGCNAVTKSFTPAANSRRARIRYRFMARDVKDGNYGIEYNDTYKVRLVGKTIALDANSMNGLGKETYDSLGRSRWNELSVEASSDQPVTASISVCNAIDGKAESKVEIAFLDEIEFAVKKLVLNDIDDSPLEFISVDSVNPYKEHFTEINGTLSITGSRTDSLKSLELHLIQNGMDKAIARLGQNASVGIIDKNFNEQGLITLDNSALLFQLSESEAAKIDTSKNSKLLLKLIGTSSLGYRFEYTYPTRLPLLKRYKGENRFSTLDEDQGGDDWALPSVVDAIEYFSSTTFFESAKFEGDIDFMVNDFSNMNGGNFPDEHKTHRWGNDVDFKTMEKQKITPVVVRQLLKFLNDDKFGKSIKEVYVTHENKPGDVVYDTLKGVVLKDTRNALDVVISKPNHVGHFHFRFNR